MFQSGLEWGLLVRDLQNGVLHTGSVWLRAAQGWAGLSRTQSWSRAEPGADLGPRLWGPLPSQLPRPLCSRWGLSCWQVGAQDQMLCYMLTTGDHRSKWSEVGCVWKWLCALQRSQVLHLPLVHMRELRWLPHLGACTVPCPALGLGAAGFGPFAVPSVPCPAVPWLGRASACGVKRGAASAFD